MIKQREQNGGDQILKKQISEKQYVFDLRQKPFIMIYFSMYARSGFYCQRIESFSPLN